MSCKVADSSDCCWLRLPHIPCIRFQFLLSSELRQSLGVSCSKAAGDAASWWSCNVIALLYKFVSVRKLLLIKSISSFYPVLFHQFGYLRLCYLRYRRLIDFNITASLDVWHLNIKNEGECYRTLLSAWAGCSCCSRDGPNCWWSSTSSATWLGSNRCCDGVCCVLMAAISETISNNGHCHNCMMIRSDVRTCFGNCTSSST